MRELAKDGLAEWDAEQAGLNQDTTKKRSPEPEPDLVSLPEKIVFQQPKRLKVETDPKAKLQALISQKKGKTEGSGPHSTANRKMLSFNDQDE